MDKLVIVTGVILCMLLTKSLASKFTGLEFTLCMCVVHVGRCLSVPGMLGNFINVHYI